jgi:hypothetical protein
MEITFILYLTNHPALFQKIVSDLSPDRLAMRVKHDLEIFPLEQCQYFPNEQEVLTYMTTRVIIAESLSASETLEKRICGQNHFLDLLNTAILTTGNRSDVLHNPFRSLSFPCTRLSRYYNTLIFVIGIHVVICTFSDAENMWRNFKSILPSISLKYFFSVDAEI